jgi:predicted RNA-binding protein with PUA-like domain
LSKYFDAVASAANTTAANNEGLAIVGIAEVVKEAYQDPTTIDPAWVAVDLKPIKTLGRPVTLAEIKAEASLQDMDLVRLSRLSVGTVKEKEFKKILLIAKKADSK